MTSRFVLSALWQLMLCVGILAQPTIEEFLDYAFPSDLTADAGQDRVAWTQNHLGIRNVFIASAPDFSPRQLTDYRFDDGQALSQLCFGNEALFFVRGGAPNHQGDFPNPRSFSEEPQREIVRVSMEGGDVSTVGEGYAPLCWNDKLYFLRKGQVYVWEEAAADPRSLFEVRGSVHSLTPSPDGRNLAFVNSREHHAYVGVYDLEEERIRFFCPSLDGDQSPVWSKDGRELAFLRIPYESPAIFIPERQGIPFSIWVADLETGDCREWWTASEGKGSRFRTVSADNQLWWMEDRYLIFPWEGDGYTHLYRLSPDGSTQCLTPGTYEVQYVTQSPDRSQLWWSSNEEDTDRQHIWNYQNGQKQRITSGNGVEWSPRISGTGSVFCLASEGRKPAHVQQIPPGAVRDITAEEDYPEEHLVEPEGVVFSAADGMRIHGQLFLPPKLDTTGQYPAVLFFHGGSRRQMLLGFHHRGYYHHAYAMNQFLASRGYVVLSVNYRSGIGYGMEFREALNYGAAGASEFNDVLGAGLFLQGLDYVDRKKIGLWGGSYGGYLTALGLAKASDMFAAGVNIHGVTDWNKVIKNFIPSYNELEDPDFQRRAFEASPLAHVDHWQSPVLLIHGDDDRNVPFKESIDLLEALRKQNVHVEQLVFPDEVHGFLLHENWLKAYQATFRFFEEHLR